MTATASKKVKDEGKEMPMNNIILEVPPAPTLITLNEFINSSEIGKAFKVETRGAFLTWVADKSPRKLSFEGWSKLLEQFSKRIV